MIKFIATLLLFTTGCASMAPSSIAPRHLVLLTDFGVKDGAVNAMRGVAYGAAPTILISDLTHEIPPYNIWEAAYRLQQSYAYWPGGTVFVTVVDPGVGSERKPIVAKSKSGFYFVGPDNGHLTLLNDDIEAVRLIDENTQRRQGSEQSYTFHGRDLFVLVGAKLAAGSLKFESVGPIATQPVVLLPHQKPNFTKAELTGQIPVLDPNYGNIWTNIPKDMIKQNFANTKKFHVKILSGTRVAFEGELPLVDTFAAVPKGQPLLYFNSLLNLSVALNQGSFASKHRIGSGPDWSIHLRAK